jgi:hypothetical protein
MGERKLRSSVRRWVHPPDANSISHAEFEVSDGDVVQIDRWSSDPNGTTIHARFADTHGHIQEQVGPKVPQSARHIHTKGRSVAVKLSTGKVMIIVNNLTANHGQGGCGRYQLVQWNRKDILR